jgi:hypothetical protein
MFTGLAVFVVMVVIMFMVMITGLAVFVVAVDGTDLYAHSYTVIAVGTMNMLIFVMVMLIFVMNMLIFVMVMFAIRSVLVFRHPVSSKIRQT